HDVRAIMLKTLARHGGHAARQKISELAFNRKDLWLAVAATNALGAVNEHLAPKLIERATAEWLIENTPAALAVALAVV
ncbi:hypothetical protein, partial [Klebsiella pneumoniae]